MPKLGERRTIEGREQMYTPAQGGWIDVKQPPETGKLDETKAPETEETAEELAEVGGELREAPEPRVDTTDLISRTAGMEDLLQMYAQRSQQMLEQQREAQKTFLEKLKTTFKPSERRREVLEEAGVPEQMTLLQESIATAKGIRENIINLESQRDAALAAAEQRPVSMATITREQAKIEEDFNRRIATASKRLAAESAYQQALQGNISLARSMAQEEVKYAMWEEDRRLDILETTYEMNQDIIESMGAEYDKIFQLAIEEAKDRRDKTEKEKDKIAELEFLAATNYGLKLDLIDKTLEEAQKEYNEAITPLAKEERELELARKRKLAAPEEPEEAVLIGEIIGFDKDIAKRFDTDIEEVYEKVISGSWGTEGARERALQFLVSKYPTKRKEIEEIIYGSDRFHAMFPDGYEKDIQPRWKPEEEGSIEDELWD